MPPAQWILDNAWVLKNIFGREYFQAFRECAVNRSHADWTTVYTYTANWVRISVLGVDGLLMQARGWTYNADLGFHQAEDDNLTGLTRKRGAPRTGAAQPG